MDITKLPGAIDLNILNKTAKSETTQNAEFEDVLKNLLGEVNTSLNVSEAAASNLALGDSRELHQVILATEQANLALQLTVQIRNKMLEAYQEVMRMQV